MYTHLLAVRFWLQSSKYTCMWLVYVYACTKVLQVIPSSVACRYGMISMKWLSLFPMQCLLESSRWNKCNRYKMLPSMKGRDASEGVSAWDILLSPIDVNAPLEVLVDSNWHWHLNGLILTLRVMDFEDRERKTIVAVERRFEDEFLVPTECLQGWWCTTLWV